MYNNMIEKYCKIWLCVMLICSAVIESGARTISFTDNGKGLKNPGMGWVHYVYGNRLWAYGADLKTSDTLDEFPGLTTVYFKMYWSDLEPEEGVFRWDIVDSYASQWTAKGYRIAFRIACCDHRQLYGTPKWVYDAGAKGYRFNAWAKDNPNPAGRGMEPLDYSDPVFLAKLENFVRAFARRYDGREEVAWVEISSFGLWGEGHTVGTSRLSQEKINEIAKVHIALWKRHFTRSQLCISDDVAGFNHGPGVTYPIMEYARDAGIAMRDDSIFCVRRDPPWMHDDMAQLFWPTLPVIIEHEHWAIAKAGGHWKPEYLLRCVEDYHASFMSVHWFPREYLSDNRALIDQINLRLGYRLMPRSVTYPEQVRIGERCEIKTEWVNTGVAPCRENVALAWTLRDATGDIRWVCSDEMFDPATLKAASPGKAEPQIHLSKVFFGNAACFPIEGDWLYSSMKKLNVLPDFLKDTNRVPTLEPGIYTLWLSVGRYDGTPLIALPIDHDDGGRRYQIGEIEALR